MFAKYRESLPKNQLQQQLGDPTEALCRTDLPPMAPPVGTWTKEEKLAGVFSGQPQTQEGPQAGFLLLPFKLVNADSCAI